MAAARRIATELREVADGRAGEKLVALMPLDPHNIRNLRGIILAPPGSPMEGYILFMDVSIPANYPFSPPELRFENKVWHPKVNSHGQFSLVHDSENWKPATRLETVLVTVQFMLAEPGDAYSALANTTAWDQYISDRATYVKVSKDCTEKDNEGYGYVTFLDYQISAIRSILTMFPGAVDYKGFVFCKEVDGVTWKLILMVVPNLTMYLQPAEQLYQEYRRLTTFRFKFTEEEITFNCGDGMTRDKCWKITDVKSLTIMKEDVVRDPRKNKPATCQLDLAWVRTEMRPRRVIHKISLGSKTLASPLCLFDVCVDPDSLSDQDHSLSGGMHISAMNERPTLVELLKFPLKNPGPPIRPNRFKGKSHIDIIEMVGHRHNKFGVLLLADETGSKITSIVSRMKENPEEINLEILRRWLSGEGKQPVTWSTLTEVLCDIYMSEIAKEIEASKEPV